MRFAVVLVLVAIAIAPSRARACAACACGDQTLTAFGVEKPYRNRLRLVIDERYTEVSFGAGAMGTTNRTLRSSLAVAWTPHKRITIAALLPLVTSWVTPLGSGARALQIIGLGDLELSARVLIFADRGFMAKHLLWGTAGLKTPTGPEATDSDGRAIEADLQPGSGSWDPFFGVTYGYFGGLTSFFASASWKQTTSGWRGYRLGSSLGASAAAQVQPWWWAAGSAGFDLRWAEPDQLANGHAAPDTGGTVLYFSPSILFSPRPSGNFLIRATVSIPFLQRLDGVQLVGTQALVSLAYDLR